MVNKNNKKGESIMTIYDLKKLCEREITKGNGNKEIWLSNDDEGNGYHEMFYGFTADVAENDLWGSIDDYENTIILG